MRNACVVALGGHDAPSHAFDRNNRRGSVRGTATAASLWITGAIGVSVGLGAFDVALMLSIATAATLWLLPPLKRLTKEPNGR